MRCHGSAGAALVLLFMGSPALGAAQTEYNFSASVLEHLPEWAPGSEVLVSVGRADGDPEHFIGHLSHAALLPNGGLTIADYLADVIRAYEPDGTHRIDFSGRGEGPGEFPGGVSVEVYPTRSGEFLAWSRSQRRAFVYGLDGGLKSEFYLRDLPSGAKLLGLSEHGSPIVILQSLDQAAPRPGRVQVDSVIALELDPESGERTEWLRAPNPSSYAVGMKRMQVRSLIPGPMVLPRVLVAMGPEGELIRGRSDRWELEWWTPGGGVSHRVTLDFPEHVVEDVHRDRMVAALVGDADELTTPERTSLERSAREILEGIERGETVAGFRVYSGGEIVVGAPRHPGQPPEPLLLSERGRPLGWLVNDPDENGRYPGVVDIRGDRVLLRIRDPDTDVVHLEIRPFGPRPAGSPPGPP